MNLSKPNRGVILTAAAVTCSFCGAIYMWSIFTNPMIAEHGWNVQEISLAYSIFLLMSMVSGFLCGKVQDKIDTRALMLIAGLLESVGWGMTGFASSIPMLYFTFGIIGGFGDGIVYNLSVSVATQWYPDKPGFASGICTGCVALSALLFAPLGQLFISHFGASGSFKLCGVIFFAFFFVFSWFLRMPPAVFVGDEDAQVRKGEAVENHAGAEAAQQKPRDFTTLQMVCQPLFWIIWVGVFLASTSGLMVTAHTSGIGQLLVGMTAAQGALMVGVFAVGNFAGRFVSGNLADRIGCANTLMLLMLCTAAEMLFFYAGASSFTSFMIQTCLLGFFFGGVMSNLPLLCSTYFGFKHFGGNYAISYSGYTVSALVGPMIAAFVLANTGGYDAAFYIAGGLSLLAFAAFLLVRLIPEHLRGRFAVAD